MFDKVLFLLNEAKDSIKSNKAIFFSTLITVSFVWLILFIFFLIVINVNIQLDKIGGDIDIVIILNPKANAEYIYREINKLDNVTEINFISSKDALKWAKKKFKDISQVSDILNEYPLPPAFKIKLNKNDENIINILTKNLSHIQGVNDILFGSKFIKKINQIRKIFNFGAVIMVIILFFISIFVISNSIRLTIFTRKENIEIMKLVGSYKMFIEIPFIIEGALQGFLSSTMALSILFGMYKFMLSHDIFIAFFRFKMMVYFVLAGIMLGVLGSLFSINRYAKY